MSLRIYLILLCVLVSGSLSPANATSPDTELFSFGFSSVLFTDVDENDARAALKVWGAVVGKQRNIPFNADAKLFSTTEEILQALKTKQVDAVGISTVEYFYLRKDIEFDHYFQTGSSGTFTEKFVLLSHRDGAIKKLSDLNGRNLFLYENARNSLATIWLDNLLHRHGQGRFDKIIGSVQKHTKLAKAVLPVFFRQVDTCLVTRSGFDVMKELNPQLGEALTVVAESEPVIPAIFVFRKSYQPSFLDDIVAGLNELAQSSEGQQILNLFSSERVVEISPEILSDALKMIEEYESLPL